MQRADGLTDAVAADVHFVVVEAGVYTEGVHGVTMEAVKYTSTTTDRAGDGNIHWIGETRSYSNAYVSPVVFGQVMTANDPNFSTFWSRGSSSTEPPSNSACYVGKHVGEDPATTRSDETIGYIVIEGGGGTISGKGYVAGLSSDTVLGYDGTPPYEYSLSCTTLQVNFNEDYDPATLGTDDLVMSEGSVTAANIVDSNTVAYTLTDIVTEGTLTVDMAAGALTDQFGNPMQAYSGSFAVDWDGDFPYPFPVPLIAEAPLGSLIYDPTHSAYVSFSGDTDSFTIDVDPSQTITLVVDPDSNLQPTVALVGPGVSESVSAGAVGENAVLQTAATTSSNTETYTITVSGVDGSIGAYTLQVILNAAVEEESNNDKDSAQDVRDSLIPLAGTGTRGAVLGQGGSLGPPATLFYADFTDGGNPSDEGFTIAGNRGLWHLSIGHGTENGHSAADSFYYGKNENQDGGGTYSTGNKANNGTITSPEIALPPDREAWLDFNYILETEGSTGWDYAWLQIDDGSGWTTLATYNGVAESSVWTAADQVDLAAYRGKTVELRWYFDTVDKFENDVGIHGFRVK